MPASDSISILLTIKNLGRHCYEFCFLDMIIQIVLFQITWLQRDFEVLSEKLFKGMYLQY